jgi:hypothetical protein
MCEKLPGKETNKKKDTKCDRFFETKKLVALGLVLEVGQVGHRVRGSNGDSHHSQHESADENAIVQRVQIVSVRLAGEPTAHIQIFF